MKLVSRDIAPSPDRAGTTRVSVRIRMELQDRELCVWFDVPEAYEAAISRTGNPWLVLMTPLALHGGEDITLPFPVDPLLLENVQAMMRFWARHFPELRPARVEAPVLQGAPAEGRKSALFFSGGVDSTFSLLRHDREAAGCGSGPVDDLVFVAGFDIPVGDTAEVELAKSYLGRVAGDHGKNLVALATNLRELDSPYLTRWILSYGCALGTVGHLLEGRYRELVISAAHGYADSPVTGSHPITDPLLSSRSLRFVHDGAAFGRLEKTQWIAAAGNALAALRVCWEGRRHDNCSRCRKCLLTMVALDLAGFRNRAPAFDWSAYSVDELGRQYVDTDVQVSFFREIQGDAERRGRQDVAEAAARALRCSLTARRIVDWIRRIPVLWRFDYQAERALRWGFGLGDRPRSNGHFPGHLSHRREARRWYL